MSVEDPFSQSSRQVCLARTGLFRALQDGGCSEPTGVLEAIEALIDAKRAEERRRSQFAGTRSISLRPGDTRGHAEQRGRAHAEAAELDRQIVADVEKRLASTEKVPPSDAPFFGLQPHGNEDAQTPGIDEGADSEAVTATIDEGLAIIANPSWDAAKLEGGTGWKMAETLAALIRRERAERAERAAGWTDLAKVMEPDGSNPPSSDFADDSESS